MSEVEVPKLEDFESLKNVLEIERKAVAKANGYHEDDEFVRTSEDAVLIFNFVRQIHENLHAFLKEYPSLVLIFNKEFVSAKEFFSRTAIFELCFLDDCLFPEKELYFFGQDGGINQQVLDINLTSMDAWIESKKSSHLKTQENLKENFDPSLKESDLECLCHNCTSEYRTKLRDHYYFDCLDFVEKTEAHILERIGEEKKLNDVSSHYYEMQKTLDKKFRKIRSRLKRSTVNRIESRINGIIKEKFSYPSEVYKKREESLYPFLAEVLAESEQESDFVSTEERDKFFSQIGLGVWKTENNIKREFKKLVKSIMILKRKDISGTILQEYLGEFWTHSRARDIKRKIIYHKGPTNSGKTYHAIEALAEAKSGCYLAPLRLLAGELYDTLNSKGVVTTLLTGEEVVEVEGATHFSSTIEMAKLSDYFDCCVIDEIQMITDSQRGWAWTRALVNMFADEIHICGDGSVLDLVQNIVDLCGDELIVKEYSRMTELNIEKSPITVAGLKKHDALIVFSRRNALRYKSELERLGLRVSIVYGRLSPEVRREQARKFDVGETDIMVSTDAISMGMNLPIKRIVFSTLSKFINSQEHVITDSEIKQIAGRAGRFKRFPTGFVTCLSRVEDGIETIRNALECDLDQKTKCMVGPDLDIFNQVNTALSDNNLPVLGLSEFLRLFNTMIFKKPFYCVELKEMIEVTEMVEETDPENRLSTTETFGFSCAPVNLGLVDHVQYFIWILGLYVYSKPIGQDPIDHTSSNIDYLETQIKCVELYQWLSRHFKNKNFVYDENDLLNNKSLAVDKLNTLLSDKIVPTCASCGAKLSESSKFAICEDCFKQRRFSRHKKPFKRGKSGGKRDDKRTGPGAGGKKRSRKRRSTGKPSNRKK